MKKDDEIFDVTMGAYDGVKVYELVGCYISFNKSVKNSLKKTLPYVEMMTLLSSATSMILNVGALKGISRKPSKTMVWISLFNAT